MSTSSSGPRGDIRNPNAHGDEHTQRHLGRDPAAGIACRCRPACDGGFTLLEVVVALTLLAVALTMLMQSFAGGLRNVDAGDRHTQAAALAEGMLSQVGASIPLQSGAHEGDSGDFAWRLELTPETAIIGGEALPGLFRVAVEVTWRRAGREQRLSLLTLRSGRREE